MTVPLSEDARAVLINLKAEGLICKNVRIGDKRTSIRLEPQMWTSLFDIAHRERCTIHDLCSAVDDVRDSEGSFTAAIRLFIVMYYRDVPERMRLRSRAQHTSHQRPSYEGRIW